MCSLLNLFRLIISFKMFSRNLVVLLLHALPLYSSLDTQLNLRGTDKYEVKEIIYTGSSFDMTWTSTNVTRQFDYFDSLTGEGVYYLMFNHSLEPQATIARVNTAIYFLLDPKYLDKKLAVISIPMNGSYNNLTESWQGQTTAAVQLYNELKIQGQTIYVANTSFVVNQTYSSLSSDFFSFTTVLRPPTYQPLLPWIMLLPSLFLIVCMHFVQAANIPSIKISLVTLFINLNFLLFISLIMLYYGVMSINNPQGWLILTGVVAFICVIKFVQCYESVIRRINNIGGYLRFYIMTFIYLWCLFNYGTTSWFIIVNSLFLVPQIIHNAYEGIRPGFYLSYIGTIAVSQFYIIYYKGCPANIMSISPNLGVCIGVVISLFLQIGTLYVQHRLGSRFFIPKKCIPGYYNYIEQMQFDLTTRLMIEDCTICLLPLCDTVEDQEDFEQNKKSRQYVDNKITKKIMKTPCNHRFHVKCLQSWMEHKMECPVDRQKLPPYQN